MLFPYATLSLSRTIADTDEVVLIASVCWRDLRADGRYREIDERKAVWLLENLGRDRASDMRQFAAAFGRLDLYRMSDGDVLAAVRNAIRARQVIAIQRGVAPGAASNATAELRALLRQVERHDRGRLAFQGRHYKLVVDVDLARLPGRDHYDVVPQTEARDVLAGIAQSSPAQADAITKASDKLTKDWRAPFSQPEGLVLLRRIPVQASVDNDDGPALTPSQMKALIKEQKEEIIDWSIWIEVDADDPSVQDDTVILLDAAHEEVERVALAGCPKSGAGVVVTFKKVDKNARYTLIRDYGPDEGGGADTLIIDRTPADLEEELKALS